MSPVELACAAQGRAYVQHSAAMLHSVLAHAPGVRVHYLCSPELSSGARTGIEAMVELGGASIVFHEIDDEQVEGLPLFYGSRATWYRVFLPDLLPDLDRILYLDVDTLVVDSLEPLWATDLGDDWVAAVTNVFQHDHGDIPGEIGLASADDFFNAGVLLMNLEAMRRDDCTQRLLDFSLAHADELIWGDQHPLNVILSPRRLPLHPRWNAMNSVMEWDAAIDVFGPEAVAEARERPAIRHFEGPSVNKPWHYECDRALRELYFEHRRATPWPDVEVEGRTPRAVLRRWLSA